VDYFNKMAELVFVTVFNTHMFKKKLTNVSNLRNQTILDRQTKRSAEKL